MLVNKGISREDAYKLVQTCAMDVWSDESKNLKDELLNNKEVMNLLNKDEIESVFDNEKMLKNVNYIFSRSVEKE
ncbi:MAG: hypothetical protein U5K00_22195 [Melioribacteraceae bacterium]|nr:hypothetical protein [Melioribacteraceae bacterium]